MENHQKTGREIAEAVAEALRAAGIEYKAHTRGEADRDGWKCDAWAAEFVKRGATIQRVQFDYYTGTGHRDKFNRPKAPPAAGVLYSVCMDCTHGASFANWCADFGYDTDSRKALTTYEQCQINEDKARKFFGAALFGSLGKMLEGY